MFYSHEVLTSRKYGVATVWLVATLGQKSGLKKVSRKQILDVDVQKACKTIVTPDAPMALRLQSNLLYGVTRVYLQQCEYVLNDAETARDKMRTAFKVLRASALHAEGGHKGRADQLLLQDDPTFLPDLDLMPVDFDNLSLDLPMVEESQRYTLSPHNSSQTMLGGSQHSIGRLIIPPSGNSLIGGAVGGFGRLSVRGDSGAGSRTAELDPFLDLEPDFEVLDDGTIRMSEAPSRQTPSLRTAADRITAVEPILRMRTEQPMGRDHGDVSDQPHDDGFVPLQNDYENFAEAPAAPEQVLQHSTTTETADAPHRRRIVKQRKTIAVDHTTELHSRDLAQWSTDYAANMKEASRIKLAKHLAALAKKNAQDVVLGAGLGAFQISDQGPLAMFTGARLLDVLSGRTVFPNAGKRGHSDDEEGVVDTPSRKRSRVLESATGEPAPAFNEDDGYVPMIEDDMEIERGREQPTPLDDRHLSSILPWNQSAGSRRPTDLYSAGAGGNFPTSISLAGPVGLLSRRGSRLISASPLMGRGAMPAGSVTDDLALLGSYGDGDIGMTGAEEFELFGPAAQVDTQTAAQSQWQRSILDSESINFLAFVQAGIEQREHTAAVVTTEDNDGAEVDSIEFEVLLPPRSNSRAVAAQALLHVLALGTKNTLDVQQDGPFGSISLRLVAAH